MVSGKIRIATAVLFIWVVIVALVMLSIRVLNLEILFTLWLIGAIFITEFLSPRTFTPRWKIMQIVILSVSVAVFAVIAVMNILTVISNLT